jgi:hypothetical protein
MLKEPATSLSRESRRTGRAIKEKAEEGHVNKALQSESSLRGLTIRENWLCFAKSIPLSTKAADR